MRRMTDAVSDALHAITRLILEKGSGSGRSRRDQFHDGKQRLNTLNNHLSCACLRAGAARAHQRSDRLFRASRVAILAMSSQLGRNSSSYSARSSSFLLILGLPVRSCRQVLTEILRTSAARLSV